MASIKQRADGVWRARYRDDAGREHARHFGLKRDAQRWLDEVATAVVTGMYVDPKAGLTTWAEWCTAWTSRQSWADGTYEAVSTAVDSVPWVNDPIGRVRPSQVQAWVSGEVKRGLAPSTVKTRLNYVQMAFRAAVTDKVIPESPATSVKPPRQRRTEAAMKTLTADQLRAGLEVARNVASRPSTSDDLDATFYGFVAVCAFAGLRLGEAAGLQLGDINFLGRSITVSRQVQGSTIKAAKLVPPKAGSERTVFVPDRLVQILSAHVAREGISAPNELLFVTPLQRMWNRNSAAAEWRRIREAAGLPEGLTIHSLRHTFASNLIAAGCDVVTVQRALGHAQPSITLNVYSHLWPSAEDRTRSATADFMAGILDSADSVRTEPGKPQVS